MSVGRLTCVAAGKISHSLTHARAIHCLTSKSWLCNNFYDEPRVDRHRSKANNDLLPLQAWKRHKYGGKKNKQRDEESSEDDEELAENANSKVIGTRVSSMRIDLIVKVGLGMARNKAEVALYESRIRINGQKVLKKSAQVKIGDVVDLIRGPSPKNPNFLVVSRITILSAAPQDDAIRIKFTRDKSLLIDNYEDEVLDT